MKNIILTLFLLNSWSAFACECSLQRAGEIAIAEEDAITNEYMGSSAVVLAKAISVEKDKKGKEHELDNGMETTEFLVIRSWKGAVGEHFRTRIFTGCCACGYSFSAGETYLLYLETPNEKGFYSESKCSRNPYFTSDRERKEILLLNKLSLERK